MRNVAPRNNADIQSLGFENLESVGKNSGKFVRLAITDNFVETSQRAKRKQISRNQTTGDKST